MASLNERAKVDYIVSEGLYSELTGALDARKRRDLVHQALLTWGCCPSSSAASS